MMKLHVKFIAFLFAVSLVASVPAYAHCDTMSGPVVRAARRALDTGDLSQALRWVRPQDEAEVTQAFTAARHVRSLGADAKELADRHFFETVVRLHRAGEGEPFTGLKDSAPDPAMLAADRAIETGDVTPIVLGVERARADGIRERFARALQTSRHADDDLAAGREYVHAYVEFIHYVAPEESDRHQGKQEAADPHQPSTAGGDPVQSKAVIDQFTAAKTRLKKKEQTKLTLAFRSEPAGAHIGWRLACSGVAIAGWDAPQLLSVSERSDRGIIQAIDARDFIVTNRPVVVVVKRPGKAAADAPARCTVGLNHGDVGAEKSIDFELR